MNLIMTKAWGKKRSIGYRVGLEFSDPWYVVDTETKKEFKTAEEVSKYVKDKEAKEQEARIKKAEATKKKSTKVEKE